MDRRSRATGQAASSAGLHSCRGRDWPWPARSGKRVLMNGRILERPKSSNQPSRVYIYQQGVNLPGKPFLYYQTTMLLDIPQGDMKAPDVPPPAFIGPSDVQDVSHADTLFATVEVLIKAMGSNVSEAEVAEHLRVEKRQAKAWLERLASEGRYSRTKRPIRYIRTLFS